ncbi:alginate O-acetyltransferase complex protein AlgI [Solirubrobacter pauli]|uniref:Alginate O-acetyltransferase complex protein AlgI n=1 Tax=Solirubrobacter pauli TaxID=166793 RepID=A0A660LCU7_9ACTN|nr:MBOAT family protein [Solirubrobacter pauli]RKQ92888.1 alginate O-acetyltransferase complex protein AlgI [Solirubrobacter pauli]
MVFSSIEFIWLFMPVVLAGYLALAPRWRNVLLAVVSLGFYVWGAHAFLFVFLFSIGLNFVAGAIIGRLKAGPNPERAKTALLVAIVFNLALLFAWKYTVFVAQQIDAVLGDGVIPVPEITLPIGISFFTFHAISYIVDIYRGQARPMRSVADYTQYMAFFPQLIAGPIVRYHEIEDQIRHPPPRSSRLDDIAEGFPRFALGLSKKVVVADPAGRVADAAFAVSANPTSGTAWIGALAYTVQIYFDFSGYSDMAIGMARMFGLRFPENFNRPYSSVSMTDFWRRWHMTLSRWFRDYVYIPLGGSRGTQAHTVRNLMFVFLLTGAWHGAAWTFVLWGVYNGLLLVGERLAGINRWSDDRWMWPRRLVTFVLVVFGWVLFRATDLGQAIDFMVAMVSFDFSGIDPRVEAALQGQAVLALVVGLASVLLPRDLVFGRVVMDRWAGTPLYARFAVLVLVPYAAVVVAAGSFSPFLYFQF